MREPKAYACTGTPEPFYTLNVTMGFVSVKALHAAAKQHGASITEYLAAILLQSILIRQRREGRRRELPVSLGGAHQSAALFPLFHPAQLYSYRAAQHQPPSGGLHPG